MKQKLGYWLLPLVLVPVLAVLLMAAASGADGRTEDIKGLVHQYYAAMSEGRYDEGLSLLHREENTMFDDDFLINGYESCDILSYEVLDVKELAEDVYAVTSHIEAVGLESPESDVENYVIYMDGQPYFVIHRTDIPEDMYFWGG